MAGEALAIAAGPVKRFYKEARIAATGGGFGLLLDGRAVKTPARAALVVPVEALALAIVEEWNGQAESIDPRTMPLTGLANAAIDRVADDPAAFAAGLAGYADSDLLCYRADGPSLLVERQAVMWDPLLIWARRRYDVELAVVTGIMHRAQASATVGRLGAALGPLDAFTLAGLSPLVTVGGSVVIALAMLERAIDVETGWRAAALDELWQIEKWGADVEAVRALADRERDFRAGARFVELLAAG